MPIRSLLPLVLLLFVASAAGAAIPGWRYTVGGYELAYSSFWASLSHTSLLLASPPMRAEEAAA